jgi:3-phosphoshikimate 1-carboxyvinyltransferase
MRALVFALLAQGKSVIFNPLRSSDVTHMIKACRLLGATVTDFADRIEVVGNLRPADDVIDAGNSGQILRFLGAVSALTSEYTILTGDASIRHLRPVQPLLDGLKQLGAFAVSSRGDGHAPIVIKGPLKGGIALISGEDSQPVSGLLIASAFASHPTQLFVTDPGEKPWISLTLSWFDLLGIPYTNDNFTTYTLPGSAAITGFTTTIPSDLSSAAYPIAAALVTQSELLLTDIDLDATQGDLEVIFQLQKMGAKITLDKSAKTLYVHPGACLKGAKIDVNNFIDAVTLFSVIGCFAEGTTEISGAKIARHKESDRIASIVTELRKMGAKIEEKEDGVIVEQGKLHGAHLKSYADHRMALSLTVATLGAVGASTLEDTACVSKSYATFFDHLKSLGARIE